MISSYMGIENGVVEGFTKVTDKFVGQFLTREGETVEEAKARMTKEQEEREAASKARIEKQQAETEKRVAQAQAMAKANIPEIKTPEAKIGK